MGISLWIAHLKDGWERENRAVETSRVYGIAQQLRTARLAGQHPVATGSALRQLKRELEFYNTKTYSWKGVGNSEKEGEPPISS